MAEVRRYLSTAQVQELLGLHRATLSSIRRRGLMPDPDILIGDLPGWDEGRIVRFGQETGRLDEDNRPVDFSSRGHTPRPTPRPWWRVEQPERFLSQAECAVMLGVRPIQLQTRRLRNTFISPDVAIGDPWNHPRRGNVFGWQEARVRAYKRQRKGIAKKR